ncbi:permease of the major facilitator superfamily [Pseudovirgaria hyperparasitica]|uniref:Permease of the major facilitator superfamily n=1 Tax=Pseudovirgaria hyperparasitica TaxID=470096 RepID=A0A6A6VWM0_9PEZI|nr:permease of the major facilitator superfamily [Pseudovirgaria hyperparasitica]KAF2754565.1 permease of the major facilitator superfamily [Pseudovirgaria hyperparasitica]
MPSRGHYLKSSLLYECPSLSSASTPPEEPTYPTGTKFWFITITLWVILILGGLDANIVATAVPSITDEFKTVTDVGWYSSAFRLCSCAFQFGFAKAYRLFPIKGVLIFNNIIFLIGAMTCALAPSSIVFILGRALSGVGFAGEMSGCFAVLVHIVPLHRRPLFAGLMAAMESCAIISAPIIGGALTQSVGWRWCFWISLPIGGIALMLLVFIFSDPRTCVEDNLTLAEKIKELDLVSNCLLIPCLTTLFVTLSWAGVKYPWSDGRVIGLFVVSVVLLTAFLYNQYRRGDSAVLPFRIIKNRTVMAGFFFTMCTNSMTNVLEWYLPIYYQIVQNKSPASSGYLMAPILAGMLIGLVLQGIGTTTFGYWSPFMIFASILMPIAAGLITTYDLNTSFAKFIIYPGLLGFSGGIGFQGPQAAVQVMLSAADINLGIGIILFGQSIGPAVFIAIAQVIFSNELTRRLQDVVPGLTPAYIAQTGLNGIMDGVAPERLVEVLEGVSKSLTTTWSLAIALGCATMVGSLLIPWRSVREKKQ